MKKVLAILMCVVFALALCACGKDSKDDNGGKGGSGSSTTKKESTKASSKDTTGIFVKSDKDNGCQVCLGKRFKAIVDNDADEFFTSFPEFSKELFKAKLESAETKEKFMKGLRQEIVASCGEKFKLSAEITGVETEKEGSAKSYLDFNKVTDVTVEESCNVTCKVIAKDPEQESNKYYEGKTYTYILRCFKIDGKWYCIN